MLGKIEVFIMYWNINDTWYYLVLDAKVRIKSDNILIVIFNRVYRGSIADLTSQLSSSYDARANTARLIKDMDTG